MAWNKKEARKGLEGSNDAVEFLTGKGMQVVKLTPAEISAFKAKVKPVYDKYGPKFGTLLDDINKAKK